MGAVARLCQTLLLLYFASTEGPTKTSSENPGQCKAEEVLAPRAWAMQQLRVLRLMDPWRTPASVMGEVERVQLGWKGRERMSAAGSDRPVSVHCM